jgi:hypothetical protein
MCAPAALVFGLCEAIGVAGLNGSTGMADKKRNFLGSAGFQQ